MRRSGGHPGPNAVTSIIVVLSVHVVLVFVTVGPVLNKSLLFDLVIQETKMWQFLRHCV